MCRAVATGTCEDDFSITLTSPAIKPIALDHELVVRNSQQLPAKVALVRHGPQIEQVTTKVTLSSSTPDVTSGCKRKHGLDFLPNSSCKNSKKRRVHFSSSDNCSSVCEILRPASDMTPSERREFWYQRDDYVASAKIYMEQIKTCKQQQQQLQQQLQQQQGASNNNSNSLLSYHDVLVAVYGACCQVASQVNDSQQHQQVGTETVLPSLSTLLAVSVSLTDVDLRGLENYLERALGECRKLQKQRTNSMIVAMYKSLQCQKGGILHPAPDDDDHRAAEALRNFYETLSRAGKVFGIAIGQADAAVALNEYVSAASGSVVS